MDEYIRIRSNKLYTYTFTISPDTKPSISCNFSNIYKKNIILQYDTITKIVLFANQYNLLRVMNGEVYIQ